MSTGANMDGLIGFLHYLLVVVMALFWLSALFYVGVLIYNFFGGDES